MVAITINSLFQGISIFYEKLRYVKGATESAMEGKISQQQSFEMTESDREEANTNKNPIDHSDSEDDLIDIEL